MNRRAFLRIGVHGGALAMAATALGEMRFARAARRGYPGPIPNCIPPSVATGIGECSCLAPNTICQFRHGPIRCCANGCNPDGTCIVIED